MGKVKRLVILLLLTVVYLFLFLNVSYAANNDKPIEITVNLPPSNVETVTANKSETIQEALPSHVQATGDYTYEAAYVVKEQQVSSLGNSKTVTVSRKYYNALGWLLFKFTHRVYWEWDSVRITKVNRNAWGTVYAPGWEYVGLIGNNSYYYDSNKSFYSFYQGHFRLGANGYYVQHVYPWIEIKVHRGGSWSSSQGG